MGKHIHGIIAIVSETKGTCRNCGTVDIKYKDGRMKCVNALREQRNRRSKHHGLTREERAEYLEGKVCAICGDVDNLVVDHCHETKSIRGALCSHCNRGLGFFKDNPTLLTAAAQYLTNL